MSDTRKRARWLAVVVFALLCAVCRPAPGQEPVAPKFLAFAFTNNAHGWAGGGDGIDVTDDGGRSWQPQFRGRRVDELIVVRKRSVFALASGAVLQTTDGSTWRLVAEPRPALKQLAFTSDRAGFGIGVDGRLYATDDGAKTWHRSAFEQPVDAVCFSDRRTGFVGGAVKEPALRAFDGIAVTRDSGATWSQATRPPTDGLIGIAFHRLHCTRGSVYDLIDIGPLAGGNAYVLARSTDSGRRWQPLLTGGSAAPLRDVEHGPGTEATSMSAYSPAAAYVAGFCGACGPVGKSALSASTDGGKTWQTTTLGEIGVTSAPVFTSPEHGWIGARIVAKNTLVPTDEVLVTDDAGRTWNPIFHTP
jgi:photosystem II stability/assembly factor-like uncharacterized protein